jgi:hypothetical protein
VVIAPGRRRREAARTVSRLFDDDDFDGVPGICSGEPYCDGA